MKIRTTVYVEDKVYKKFKAQSTLVGKTISERISEFMEKEVRKSKEGK